MKILVALLSFSLLLAPAPWGIALNHETKECGGYWAGDEYGSSELPPGWTDYYPDHQAMIQTEVGSCNFGSTGPSGDAEGCCQELGYTYLGPSIGQARVSPLMGFFLGSVVCTGLAVLVVIGLLVALVVGGAIFLWKRRRKTHQGGYQG